MPGGLEFPVTIQTGVQMRNVTVQVLDPVTGNPTDVQVQVMLLMDKDGRIVGASEQNHILSAIFQELQKQSLYMEMMLEEFS